MERAVWAWNLQADGKPLGSMKRPLENLALSWVPDHVKVIREAYCVVDSAHIYASQLD
jgi:hypothetical protein